MTDEIEMSNCVSCGDEFAEDDLLTTYTDSLVCSSCALSCARCDAIGTDGWSWYDVENDTWCESCWDAYGWACQRCDWCYDIHNVSYSTVYGDGWDENWCEGCLERNAVYCDNCDEYRPDDSACGNCGEEGEEQEGIIHSYSYKPNPVFHGSAPNSLFMGFELEMEINTISSGEYREAVSFVTALESNDVCYLKSDSSISGNGFELVTHPHTLEAYDKANALWDYIELLRTKYEARSYDTESCGLHVHVSRSAFRSGAHTHRFLSLIYKNPKEMMRLAGRKNSRYARFSDVYQPDEWGVPQFTLKDKIHNGNRTERYSAVNTGNDYTLELRFFRGNMKREGIMSALELCHASVEYTRDMTVSDVKLGMLKWEWFSDWVEANNGLYPNLYLRMSKVRSINLDNRPMINA